jgi:dTDP-4-dehydrorhamnose 3,5-epimerase
MTRFALTETPLAGVKVVERELRGDARGFLVRLFCAEELAQAGWRQPIAQINHTRTARRGTVRGMHFQLPPHAEMKLVMCMRGSAWDVAVDLRAGSSTFLRWHSEVLSADNRKALLIPEGCAHGFQAVSDDCELIYLHSAAYAPDSESALNALDPRLNIAWPEAVVDRSARDQAHPMLDSDFQGIRV